MNMNRAETFNACNMLTNFYPPNIPLTILIISILLNFILIS
jgi:hypothetical protein